MLRFVLKNNYAVQDVDDLKRVFQGRGDVDEVRSCSRRSSLLPALLFLQLLIWYAFVYIYFTPC